MTFTGLHPDAVAFFAELQRNNTKQWWTANKTRYDENVRGPFEALGAELEPEFGALKIFRPHRDVRFSADKTPYKLQIGMVSRAPIAHYVQLSDEGLLLGGGAYRPPAAALARFRAIVDDIRLVGDVDVTLEEIADRGMELMTRDELKTAPRGYSADHPHIRLLRQKNLAVGRTEPLADWMWRPEALEVIREHWRTVSLWCDWLDENLGDDIGR